MTLSLYIGYPPPLPMYFPGVFILGFPLLDISTVNTRLLISLLCIFSIAKWAALLVSYVMNPNPLDSPVKGSITISIPLISPNLQNFFSKYLSLRSLLRLLIYMVLPLLEEIEELLALLESLEECLLFLFPLCFFGGVLL